MSGGKKIKQVIFCMEHILTCGCKFWTEVNKQKNPVKPQKCDFTKKILKVYSTAKISCLHVLQ